MNKKVLTLCAAMLLTGSLATLDAKTTLGDFVVKPGVEWASNVMKITKDVDLQNDFLLIEEDGVTLEGVENATFKGRIVITGENVTVKNLNIVLENKASNNSIYKNAITVLASSATIIDNEITCVGNTQYMANGISIFPTAKDAKFIVKGNTIIGANSQVGNWQSAGILISENMTFNLGEGFSVSPVKLENFDIATIANNTYKKCAADYAYTEYNGTGATSEGYKAICVTPQKDNAGKYTNQAFINSLIESSDENTIAIFNGTVEEFKKSLTVSTDGVNVAIQCTGDSEGKGAANVLYGNAENPSNDNPVEIVGVDPLKEDLYGYELIEKATSDYSMLILRSNVDKSDWAISTGEEKLATQVTAANIDDFATDPDALWQMSSRTDKDGTIWYQFKNQSGKTLEVNGETWFEAQNKAAYSNGVVLALDGIDLTEDNKNYFGLYKAGNKVLTVDDLMWYEKDGFSVTIKYKDENGEFKKEDIAGNPFQKHLTPMYWTGEKFVEFTNSIVERDAFYLKDAEGNYIVAQKYASSGSTQSQSTYVFTTVPEQKLEHDLVKKEGNYYGSFRAEVLGKYSDMQKLSAIDVLKVELPTGWAEIGRLDLGTKEVPTLAASVSTDLKPILIALGSNKVVNPKTFLQKGKFYTVTLLDKEGKGKYLAVADDKYDGYYGNWFVESYGNDLEIQFALTYENGYFVFSNRETTSEKWTLPANQLYYGEGENEYVYGNNTYVIETVKEHAATDGYETLKDVKNNKFYIGYASGVYGNAWLTENHEGTNNHTIGLNIDQEKALTFTATEYAAERTIKHNKDTHVDTYYPTDSIYVISTLGYFEGNTYKTTKDTLKVVSYSFVNQWNEPLTYSEEGSSSRYVSQVYKNPSKKQRFESVAEAAPYAEKFALRIDNGKLNLRPVVYDGSNYSSWIESSEFEHSYTHQNFGKNEKVYAGDAAVGILDNEYLYNRTENDLFVVEPTEKAMYRRVVSPLDTISIYRNDNNKSVLFESKGFLGMENLSQFPDIAPGMVADTAYIGNGDETYYRPQYMLVVNPDITPAGRYCPIHGDDPTCPDAHKIDTKGWVEGRYLVNLVDTAITWDIKNKHKDNNPYINSEKYYRLGFVQAKHYNDSLIVASTNDTLFVGGEDFNQAKFAFRYVDQAAGSFVIETANYKRLPNATKAVRNGEGYIKWMNGVVVVVDDIKNADVFNMTEGFEGDPTANEEIATSSVVVAGVNGAVVVKGAEGKNVIVSTILGKVVANEVVSSDNATIAAPAGVVVVSVDGESFKVVVK